MSNFGFVAINVSRENFMNVMGEDAEVYRQIEGAHEVMATMAEEYGHDISSMQLGLVIPLHVLDWFYPVASAVAQDLEISQLDAENKLRGCISPRLGISYAGLCKLVDELNDSTAEVRHNEILLSLGRTFAGIIKDFQNQRVE